MPSDPIAAIQRVTIDINNFIGVCGFEVSIGNNSLQSKSAVGCSGANGLVSAAAFSTYMDGTELKLDDWH
jgi:hypothetical protein